MRIVPLALCAVIGSSLLYLPQLNGQSLGAVARASKASKKTTRVVTNDNLPEASGPANGAASMPIQKAAAKESLPEESDTKTEQKVEPEKELQEQISFLDGQVATLKAKMEEESNEAVRSSMQQLASTLQDRRARTQQELNELKAATNSNKSHKN